MSELDTIQIGDHHVGEGQPAFIIAEAGVNHGGSLDRALQLVDGAKEAGADAVKFQTWDVDELYIPDEMSGQPLRENSRERCLSYEDIETVKQNCEEQGIMFLSTPDERQSADFLDSIGVPAFKIGSGDLTNTPFLKYVAQKGKPMIVSTGMATEKIINRALESVRETGLEDIIVLHCVSSYPADISEINLSYLPVLRTITCAPVGLSDHTESNLPAVVARSLGARVIEKHFTIDKGWPGVDNDFAYTVDEMAELINRVRKTEKVLGDPVKKVRASEQETRSFARKRIVAAKDIGKHEKIEEDMLAYKRPKGGIAPFKYDKVVGKRAIETIKEDETVIFDKLEDNNERSE
jgi:sialic acid synthase SpsE